jgi:hypothetical protein
MHTAIIPCVHQGTRLGVFELAKYYLFITNEPDKRRAIPFGSPTDQTPHDQESIRCFQFIIAMRLFSLGLCSECPQNQT